MVMYGMGERRFVLLLSLKGASFIRWVRRHGPSVREAGTGCCWSLGWSSSDESDIRNVSQKIGMHESEASI
jgi:hypothetical protein